MAFKTRTGSDVILDDPESLLRHLPKKTIVCLLSHQSDIIRSYLTLPADKPDVALHLPTRSGKTLVGLLIAEWRRRKYHERVVFLCATSELVNQAAQQARTKYGMNVTAFTGKTADYDLAAMADWRNGDAIAITDYRSFFNLHSFFADPHLIVLDDAHSAENFIASHWSVQLDRSNKNHAAIYSALMGVLLPLVPPPDRGELASSLGEDAQGARVSKIPTPSLVPVLKDVTSLLDRHTRGLDLHDRWQVIRPSLEACHVYVSSRCILIRPLIPPSSTHSAFAGARQRLYLSATLGAGGDLERITGRPQIERVRVPQSWEMQCIGRRFFLFPKRSLDDAEISEFVATTIARAGRALYLAADDQSARRVNEWLQHKTGFQVSGAEQLENSEASFVGTGRAIAVKAKRHDGFDLVDDECRLLFVDGLPRPANLQEQFFITQAGAQVVLGDRMLTRVVQGFSRCSDVANSFVAVVALGEDLQQYLLAAEQREFFHPEIQAELGFGLDESKDTTAEGIVENLGHFLGYDIDWQDADAAIVKRRIGLTQKPLPATEQLASTVNAELAYQAAMWNGDFNGALGDCRTVLSKLGDDGLRGYRALWMYLAGSAAWLAAERGLLGAREIARDYFAKAQGEAPELRWPSDLQRASGGESVSGTH